MDEEKFSNEVAELRKVLERIEEKVGHMMAKSTRQWMNTYYDSVAKIPDYFRITPWNETEKTIYDSIVEEINGDFTARNMLHSGMYKELLKILDRERKKVLHYRI